MVSVTACTTRSRALQRFLGALLLCGVGDLIEVELTFSDRFLGALLLCGVGDNALYRVVAEDMVSRSSSALWCR